MRRRWKEMLIIGRRKPVRGDRFGGVVVAFESFLDYLDRSGVPHRVIDINHQNYAFRAWFVLRAWAEIKWAILFGRQEIISLQGTNRDMVWFAPLIVFLARLTGKQVTVRKIGGDFDQFYAGLSLVKKHLVDYVLSHTDRLFLETRYLVSGFSHTGRAAWFPNMRPMTTTTPARTSYHKRFLFMSRVERTKGVDEILRAIQLLPDDYTVDIYGPDFGYEPDPSTAAIFQSSYKGSVEPEDVPDILGRYDVLILPTRYPGEGYPGIILEAYAHGLPVITTRWRAIPEIVRDGETGYLISPGSAGELVEAMKRMDEESYPVLSRQARLFMEQFDSERLLPGIIDQMQGVRDGD